jgi:predicted transcriptional regulator
MVRTVDERDGVYRLSDERTAVQAGMNDARRGDFLPDEEMDEFYRLHLRLRRHSGARA